MPKRRTEDAVHVTMTDHRIWRQSPAGNLLAPMSERHDRKAGVVAWSYPGKPQSRDDELYLLVAQARSSPDARTHAARLEQWLVNQPADSADPYLTLADTWNRAGDAGRAITAWRKALKIQPGNAEALTKLAGSLMAAGKMNEAVMMLENAIQGSQPEAGVLNALAVLYGQGGRYAEAVKLLGIAVQKAPEDPVSWLNTGVCLEALGDKKGAEAAYRQAALLQPDLTRAQEFLKRLSEH